MFRSGNGRFLYKQVDSLPDVFKSIRKAKHSNADCQTDEKVVIPRRIERGPTDVLEALSATVGIKSTAFHYKYPDDPYFYPYSRFSEKIYALALESGRKSARWVFKENPKFFMKQLSEPLIKEFIPKQVEASESETTEMNLICAIEERNVPEAIRVYKALLEENVEISNATKQCLLELVCFFNSQEKPNLGTEEKWFLTDQVNIQRVKGSEDFAMELFQSMDSNCPLAISTMIQGKFKYNDFQTGFDLFETARVKKIKLSVGVYNAILSKLHVLEEIGKESIPARIKEILQEMSNQNIKPNLGTLNSTLSTISESMMTKHKLAQEVMNEFTGLGIKPSLGTYGCLFRCMKSLSFIPLADSLLASIEHKHHEVLHPTDFKFFSSAMKAIDLDLKSPDLAVRLMKMFERNNNSKFIVTLEDKNALYRHFFVVLFSHSPLESAMKMYKSYIFTKFHAETIVYQVILKAIKRTKSYNLLAELWEEMEIAKANQQKRLLKIIMEMVDDCENPDGLKVCHAAALTYLKSQDRMNGINGVVCSTVVLSLLKNQDYSTFKSYWDEVQEFQDILDWSHSAITEMYKYAMSQHDKAVILDILKIGKNACHPNFTIMAEDALLLLDESSKGLVQKILEDFKKDQSNVKNVSEFKRVLSDDNHK